MRAAIYIRVSTEDQVRHGYSLAEQREACRKRAYALGAVSITEFADEGISGGILDRPGLMALRKSVKDNQFDMLIIREPDRLSRKLSHQLILTEEIEKAKITLDFIDFAWQDTPEGRLFYSIRGAIAEFEREKIKDRMTRGKYQKAIQGGIPIGFYNYGYLYDPDNGSVLEHKHEAATVRDIFDWFISEDIGVNGLAKRLNEIGIPTRKKKKWHRVVVRQILKNPVYVGKWQYKDITIPVPALVDEMVWEKAQQKLKEARRLWAGKGKHEYLLSGIITCVECGNTMTGIYANRWGVQERRYTCRKHYQGAGKTGCEPVKMILADPIESVVWNQVSTWLHDQDALALEAAASFPQTEACLLEQARVEKYLAEIDQGREAVLDALASGLIDIDDGIKKRLLELKSRRERLLHRQNEILAKLNESKGINSRLDEIKELSQGILLGLHDLSMPEKKELTRSIVTRVMVAGRGSRGASNRLKDIRVTVVARLPDMENSFTNTAIYRKSL